MHKISVYLPCISMSLVDTLLVYHQYPNAPPATTRGRNRPRPKPSPRRRLRWLFLPEPDGEPVVEEEEEEEGEEAVEEEANKHPAVQCAPPSHSSAPSTCPFPQLVIVRVKLAVVRVESVAES